MKLRWKLLAATAAASVLAAAALARGGQPVAVAAAAERPNILVFLADDLGQRDTSPYGDPAARTPNLQRLADNGVTFNRAFVASPACAPSRAALLTGMMPARNGAEANHALPRPAIRKLPSYLQELGYEVVSFGKVSHYEHTSTYGFDHWEHDTFHDPEGVPSAIRWLRARRDKRPLAIFVGSNWPHVPWPETTEGHDPAGLALPPKSVDTPATRDARARYYAAISHLDRELGDTLTAVDQVLGPDTLVMFSSDHGAQWPFGKWNLYDTGTRVPLIVRWAGQVRPGTRTDAMVNWTDILPTLVEAAGGRPPADIDGRSFAGALRPGGRYAGRTEIFTTHNNDRDVNVYPMRAIRTARWKYISNLYPEWTYTTHIDQYVQRVDSGSYWPSWRQSNEPAAGRIVGSYYRRPAEELYDLAADPAEEHNLAADPRHLATLRRLRDRLDRWRRAQGDDHPIEGKPHLREGRLEGEPG